MEVIGPLQNRVMKHIWRNQATTVSEVHEMLSAEEDSPKLAYTTVLTVMRNLARRGILDQQRGSGRAHKFYPIMTENEYQRLLLSQICDDFFDGEKEKMLMVIN